MAFPQWLGQQQLELHIKWVLAPENWGRKKYSTSSVWSPFSRFTVIHIKRHKNCRKWNGPPQFWTNSNIGSQMVLSRKILPSSREFPVKWLLNPMLFRFWGLIFYSSDVFLAVIQCIYNIIYIYHYTIIHVYVYICIQYTVYSIQYTVSYRKREQERVYYNAIFH